MNQLIKLITNEQKNTYQVQTTLSSFGPISVGGLCGCSSDGGGSIDDTANHLVSPATCHNVLMH